MEPRNVQAKGATSQTGRLRLWPEASAMTPRVPRMDEASQAATAADAATQTSGPIEVSETDSETSNSGRKRPRPPRRNDLSPQNSTQGCSSPDSSSDDSLFASSSESDLDSAVSVLEKQIAMLLTKLEEKAAQLGRAERDIEVYKKEIERLTDLLNNRDPRE